MVHIACHIYKFAKKTCKKKYVFAMYPSTSINSHRKQTYRKLLNYNTQSLLSQNKDIILYQALKRTKRISVFSKNLPSMSVARVNKHYIPMFCRFKAINLF